MEEKRALCDAEQGNAETSGRRQRHQMPDASTGVAAGQHDELLNRAHPCDHDETDADDAFKDPHTMPALFACRPAYTADAASSSE